MMHYSATETDKKNIEPEGLYLVDSGGQYVGGTTDVTRTIALGPVTDTMKKHFSKTACGMLRLADTKFLYGCTLWPVSHCGSATLIINAEQVMESATF